jgi:Mrp family chromosome partitioning ATPase
LGDVLAGKASLTAVTQRTRVPGLEVLPWGAASRHLGLGFESSLVRRIVCELREQYSLVLVDLPEAPAIGQSLWLARMLDRAIVVVRSERVGREAARAAVERLGQDGVPIVGAIVNDTRKYLPDWLERML